MLTISSYLEFANEIIAKYQGTGAAYDQISMIHPEAEAAGESEQVQTQQNIITNLYKIQNIREENYLSTKNLTFLTTLLEKRFFQNVYPSVEKQVEKVIREEFHDAKEHTITQFTKMLQKYVEREGAEKLEILKEHLPTSNYYKETERQKEQEILFRKLENIYQSSIYKTRSEQVPVENRTLVFPEIPSGHLEKASEKLSQTELLEKWTHTLVSREIFQETEKQIEKKSLEVSKEVFYKEHQNLMSRMVSTERIREVRDISKLVLDQTEQLLERVVKDSQISEHRYEEKKLIGAVERLQEIQLEQMQELNQNIHNHSIYQNGRTSYQQIQQMEPAKESIPSEHLLMKPELNYYSENVYQNVENQELIRQNQEQQILQKIEEQKIQYEQNIENFKTEQLQQQLQSQKTESQEQKLQSQKTEKLQQNIWNLQKLQEIQLEQTQELNQSMQNQSIQNQSMLNQSVQNQSIQDQYIQNQNIYNQRIQNDMINYQQIQQMEPAKEAVPSEHLLMKPELNYYSENVYQNVENQEPVQQNLEQNLQSRKTEKLQQDIWNLQKLQEIQIEQTQELNQSVQNQSMQNQSIQNQNVQNQNIHNQKIQNDIINYQQIQQMEPVKEAIPSEHLLVKPELNYYSENVYQNVENQELVQQNLEQNLQSQKTEKLQQDIWNLQKLQEIQTEQTQELNQSTQNQNIQNLSIYQNDMTNYQQIQQMEPAKEAIPSEHLLMKPELNYYSENVYQNVENQELIRQNLHEPQEPLSVKELTQRNIQTLQIRRNTPIVINSFDVQKFRSLKRQTIQKLLMEPAPIVYNEEAAKVQGNETEIVKLQKQVKEVVQNLKTVEEKTVVTKKEVVAQQKEIVREILKTNPTVWTEGNGQEAIRREVQRTLEQGMPESIDRITTKVYRRLEEKLKMERGRRGMN